MVKILLTIAFASLFSISALAQIIDLQQYEFDGTLTNLNDTEALYIGRVVQKFDLNSMKWEKVAALNIPRIGHNSIRLSDGRILVVGGSQRLNGQFSPVLQPEIYNPALDAWTLAQASSLALKDGTLIQLDANRVLAIGSNRNDSIPKCDVLGILDINNLTWQIEYGPGWQCRYLKAYKLLSGKILFLTDNNGFDTRIYDPQKNQWDKVNSPNGFGGLTGQLTDGRVFAAIDDSYGYSNQKKILIWNELTSTWDYLSDVKRIREGSNNKGKAFGLPDGRMLFYSYRRDSNWYDGEIFNPSTGKWSDLPEMKCGVTTGPGGLHLALFPKYNKLLVVAPNDSGSSEIISY